MTTQIAAIFENGVLRPLEPLSLSNHQEVTLTISEPSSLSDQAHFILPEHRWNAFCEALDSPSRAIPVLGKLLQEPSVFDGCHAPR